VKRVQLKILKLINEINVRIPYNLLIVNDEKRTKWNPLTTYPLKGFYNIRSSMLIKLLKSV